VNKYINEKVLRGEKKKISSLFIRGRQLAVEKKKKGIAEIKRQE
jgi:hypothetical protein